MLRPACAYVCMALDLHVSFSKNVLFHKFKLVLSVKNTILIPDAVFISYYCLNGLCHCCLTDYIWSISSRKKRKEMYLFIYLINTNFVYVCVWYIQLPNTWLWQTTWACCFMWVFALQGWIRRRLPVCLFLTSLLLWSIIPTLQLDIYPQFIVSVNIYVDLYNIPIHE